MPFTIDDAKALAAGYMWILLVKFTFTNGDILYVSTHDVTYGGQAYLGILAEQDLEKVQAMSESGVDIPPSMTFHFADANSYAYLNYERGAGRGFRGAKVEARLAFYDVLGNAFSTDSIVRFVGVCDPATPIDETKLEVRAQNRLNASKKMLPPFLMQRHCAKIRPLTASQCAQADNEDSDFFWCGITDPGQPDCNNTRDGCQSANNLPRFMGLTYQPPRDGGKGKEYTSGQWVQLYNSSNDAKYGEPYPLVLGRGWVECPVLVMEQNGNYTVLEVGLCVDHVDTGYSATVGTRVVVNGTEMPPGGYDTGGGWQSLNPGNIGYWNWYTRGLRDGRTLSDLATDHGGKGDPYGSLTTIQVTVPRQIASGDQVPRVSVLFSGPQIRAYSDATTYAKQWTDNPSWVLLWVLANSNWRYDELDLQSFVDSASVCDGLVPYTSQYGGTLNHARFKCNLILRQRRQASEIIRGIRQTANMMLLPNRTTGLLSLSVKGTLAAQQPAAVSGSNYNTPVASKGRDGTATNGYVAYRFTEDNTISVRGIPRPITDTPNRIAFQFQDSENNYAPTSLALAETDDVERVGQEVSATVQIDGCANYDQAMRIGQMIHKETHRGNPVGDTRGTQWFEVVSGIGALRVGVGQIGMVDWTKLGLSAQLVRVMSVKGPTKEGLLTFSVHWHEDNWYVDAQNQRPDPEYSNPRRDQLLRASYPPCPDIVAPHASDPYYSETDKTFALAPEWTLGADGSWQGRIKIRSKLGVNEFGGAQPPQVQSQANVASTGGSLVTGTYYIAAVAKDSDGKLSPLSLVSVAIFQPGVSAGVATVPVLWWDAAATGYSIFAGQTPFRLTWQADGVGTPSSVSLSSYNECSYGAPDTELDALVPMGKVVRHSGILGAVVAAVGANSLTIGGGWTVNALAGYECSILAKGDGSELPVANYAISANTVDGILTVSPDPVADGIAIGDVLVVRSKPTISDGGRTFTDPMWMNPLSNAGAGLNPDDEAGKAARIVAGTGMGLTNRVASATTTSHTMASDWLVEPDSTTRIIIEDAEWLPLDAPFRPISNSDPAAELTLAFPINNYVQQTILVGLKTMDGSENSCVDALIRVRELYVFGEPPGVKTVTADYTVQRGDRTIMADASAGPITITLLPTSDMTGLPLTFYRVDASPNTVSIDPDGTDTVNQDANYELNGQKSVLNITAT